MTPVIIVTILFSAAVLIVLTAPFFIMSNTELVFYNKTTDPKVIKVFKKKVLLRWISEERAFIDKLISQREWKQRKRHLGSRYIDLAKREHLITSIKMGR